MMLDKHGTLSVTGTGKVQGTPDEAVVDLGVVTEGKTAAEAVASNARVTQAVIDAASAQPNHGVTTTGLSVSPILHFDQTTGVSTIVGFRATNGVEVRTEIADAGQVYDAGIAAGANASSGITFRIQDETPYREQALRLAVENAHQEAKVVAQSARVDLLSIQAIHRVSRRRARRQRRDDPGPSGAADDHRHRAAGVSHASLRSPAAFFTDPARWWGEGSAIDPVVGGAVRIVYPGGRAGLGSGARDRARSSAGGTRLALRHDVDSAAVRDAHVPGWRYQLARFADIVARDAHVGADEAVAADARGARQAPPCARRGARRLGGGARGRRRGDDRHQRRAVRSRWPDRRRRRADIAGASRTAAWPDGGSRGREFWKSAAASPPTTR
jgi:uncharacterized protein YggE